jgi:hypothetical protein
VPTVVGHWLFGLLMSLIQRDMKRVAPLAQRHERLVDGNARDPRGKACASLELAKIAMGLQQSFLLGILGVGVVARNPEGEPKNAFLTAGCQLVERGIIGDVSVGWYWLASKGSTGAGWGLASNCIWRGS